MCTGFAVHAGLREVARDPQDIGHAAMPEHEHALISLFFGKRQDLRGTLARQVAVECGQVR